MFARMERFLLGEFENRNEAGKLLARKLVAFKDTDAIVFGLPRGGVPVAYEIARSVHHPLDVFIVRKLGVPSQPELAVGAISEKGSVVLDEELIKQLAIPLSAMMNLEEREKVELARRQKVYRGKRSVPNMQNKIAILVDDGMATGLSMRAAIKDILKQPPRKLVIAVPVASTHAFESTKKELRDGVDEIIALSIPGNFEAVGQYYKQFEEVSDQKVIALLNSGCVQ